jgi:hypothetical protein
LKSRKRLYGQLHGREYAKKRREEHPELKVIAQEQRQINWEQSIVYDSRRSDKDAERTYDQNEYINVDFLRDLLQKQNGLCAYCKDPMIYGKGINRNTNPSGLSIQRILTIIAHTQNNCVFTCMLCNTLEVDIPHEMMIFGKELRLKTMLYCSSTVHVGNNPVLAADWYKNGKYGAHCKICIKKTRKSRAKP